jgi:hypothetical protein
MPAPPVLTRPTPSSGGRFARVEYLDFRDIHDCREYRLAIHWPQGPAEVRLRIANDAFGAGRARFQDGPEICYQKLLRVVASGGTETADVVMIDDAELASYREAHTPVAKHRPWTPPATPAPPFVPRAQPPRPPSPQMPVAKAAEDRREPGLGEGQRVYHAVFGIGVVASSDRGHTIVHFDEGGRRALVTSLVQLEVLSAPHTWETGPRGKNRPRGVELAAPDSVRRPSSRRPD